MSLLTAFPALTFRPSSAPTGYLLDVGMPFHFACGGLRRLRTAWTGAAIRIAKGTGSTQTDIGFDGSGNLDTAAIVSFAAGEVCYVVTIYDQSGRNFHATTAYANAYRIYDGSTVDNIGGVVSMRATGDNKGYVSPTFSAYTGSDVFGFLVGAISNTSSSLSPRFLSLMPSNAADIDGAGVVLVARKENTSSWGQYKAGTWTNKSGTYGLLSQVTSKLSAQAGGIYIDRVGTGNTFTSNTFNMARVGIGYSGSAFISAAGQYISEFLVFPNSVSTSIQQKIENNQRTYYSTPNNTPGTDIDPALPNWTLVEKNDFTSLELGQLNLQPAGANNNPRQEFKVYDYGYSTYNKDNSGNPYPNNGRWMASQVYVENDSAQGKVITLEGKVAGSSVAGPIRWAGAFYWVGKNNAGIGGGALPENGVRWEYRARCLAGIGYAPVSLTWPIPDGSWPVPGEIDIIELFGSNRNGGETNLHLHPSQVGSSRAKKLPGGSANYNTDWTQWVDVACEWVPTQFIKIYKKLPGDATWTLLATELATSDPNTNFVPKTRAHRLTFQWEMSGNPSNINQGPVKWQIASVACYKRAI